MDTSDRPNSGDERQSAPAAPPERPAGEARGDQPDTDRLTLTALTRAAGVSVRTVRYYIAEGLLPPPEGAGPRSAYRRGHLDRLRLIARLKAAYLPLKEIRRRLAGLDDEAVRGLLTAMPDPEAEPASPAGASFESASAYLDRVLGARPAETTTPRSARSTAGAHPAGGPEPAVEADVQARSLMEERRDVMRAQSDPAPGRRRPLPIGVGTPLWPSRSRPPADSEPDAWRRVSLGEDAELLIRESAYHRRRDRIDWLIRWARKVLG